MEPIIPIGTIRPMVVRPEFGKGAQREASQFGDLLVTMVTVVPKISFVTMEPIRNNNAGIFAMTTVVKILTVYAYHTMPC